jgi:hypothetical protein
MKHTRFLKFRVFLICQDLNTDVTPIAMVAVATPTAILLPHPIWNEFVGTTVSVESIEVVAVVVVVVVEEEVVVVEEENKKEVVEEEINEEAIKNEEGIKNEGTFKNEGTSKKEEEEAPSMSALPLDWTPYSSSQLISRHLRPRSSSSSSLMAGSTIASSLPARGRHRGPHKPLPIRPLEPLVIGTCVSYDEGEASRRVAYIVEYDESDQGFFYVVSGPNGGHRKRVCHGDVAMEEDVCAT